MARTIRTPGANHYWAELAGAAAAATLVDDATIWLRGSQSRWCGECTSEVVRLRCCACGARVCAGCWREHGRCLTRSENPFQEVCRGEWSRSFRRPSSFGTIPEVGEDAPWFFNGQVPLHRDPRELVELMWRSGLGKARGLPGMNSGIEGGDRALRDLGGGTEENNSLEFRRLPRIATKFMFFFERPELERRGHGIAFVGCWWYSSQMAYCFFCTSRES